MDAMDAADAVDDWGLVKCSGGVIKEMGGQKKKNECQVLILNHKGGASTRVF
jgi:hypothetical protein